MIDQGSSQNAKNNWGRLLETRREDKGKQLRFVADFRKRNDAG
jgi:hypothetical protein